MERKLFIGGLRSVSGKGHVMHNLAMILSDGTIIIPSGLKQMKKIATNVHLAFDLPIVGAHKDVSLEKYISKRLEVLKNKRFHRKLRPYRKSPVLFSCPFFDPEMFPLDRLNDPEIGEEIYEDNDEAWWPVARIWDHGSDDREKTLLPEEDDDIKENDAAEEAWGGHHFWDFVTFDVKKLSQSIRDRHSIVSILSPHFSLFYCKLVNAVEDAVGAAPDRRPKTVEECLLSEKSGEKEIDLVNSSRHDRLVMEGEAFYARPLKEGDKVCDSMAAYG